MKGTVDHPAGRDPLQRDAAWSVLFALLALGVLALALAGRLSLGDAYFPKAAAVYASGAVLMFRELPRHRPWRRFGAANRVTLLRLVLAALTAGLVAEQAPGVAWAAVGMAALAVSLDGVDGWLARRSGMASAFGARFDMEVDAFLILVLALLAWHLGKAGGWVIMAGAMRYGFVAAGHLHSWLTAPLPPSRRRKVVCVVQLLTLILCLVPWVKNPWSDMVAAVGLGFLCYSFWVDVAWLAQHRRSTTQEENP